MWKFLTRGIRESFERRGCRTNVYSQSSHENSGNSNAANEKSKLVVCDSKCIAPSFSAFYHGYCGDGRHLGAKDEGSKNKYDAKYTWSEAVGWSSVLAVGYVVCQSLCIRHKLFEIDKASLVKWRNTFTNKSQAQVSRLFNQFLLPKPKYILPTYKAIEAQEKAEVFVADAFDVVDGPSKIEQAYGPITAEEAFKEAVDEFASTHETIVGELELDYGSKAIEEKRYEEAVEHFITGSNLSSSGSMFNLGLCYELGLGTSTDHEKAVEFYKKAADKGHADAMYNLGVYHAQGKGGLKTNLDTARHFFTEAAKKGQIQAIKALQLERSFKKSSPTLESRTKHKLDAKTINNNLESNTIVKLMNYNIFMTDLNDYTLESDQCISSYDKNVNMKSPTDLFLDMLGVHETSAIPLLSVGESGP